MKRLDEFAYCDFAASLVDDRFWNSEISQDSILGPILFVLYTNDVPTSLSFFTEKFADFGTGKNCWRIVNCSTKRI